jgi:hypothetical protein
MGSVRYVVILLKNPRSSVEGLRARPETIEGTNEGVFEIVVAFPFMLRLVEAFLALFSRIHIGIYS